jgi:hypothetical protein
MKEIQTLFQQNCYENNIVNRKKKSKDYFGVKNDHMYPVKEIYNFAPAPLHYKV